MAERLEPTVRYVAVDGPVSRIEPAPMSTSSR